jgi:hypothetical protein
MSDSLHRAHEPHDVPGRAPGEIKIYHSIAVRQLSSGGALIEIGVPLQIESAHDFRLTLGEFSVVVKGRVVHSHISTVGLDRVTYHTGVEFVALSEPVARAITAYVDTLAAQTVTTR